MSNEKNKKDLLTDEAIIKDLLAFEKQRPLSVHEKWSSALMGCVVMPALIGGLLSGLYGFYIIAAVVALVAAGLCIYNYRRSLMRRKRIANGGYIVLTERLSGVLEETVPDMTRRLLMRSAWFLHFSLKKWEIPCFNYSWSERYHMSCKGVVNTSITGDEFYVVLYNDTHEIGYAYPKKFFEWEGEKTAR